MMYDHPSLILQQHTHRATAPQSGASRAETSTAPSATTRQMRAGSCSNTSPSNPVDTTMAIASPLDSEDSARPGNSSSPHSGGARPPAPSPFDRKRKCDALDRLPRTPLPTLSSSPQLSTPRPRRATYTNGILSFALPSKACHHSPPASSFCTASCTDAFEDDGNQPKSRSRSPTERPSGPFQPHRPHDNHESNSFTSSLIQVPTPSLVARRRSIQASSPNMTKRPRLDSSASASHLQIPEASYGLHGPQPLDLNGNALEDGPSAPPSASFSNLTITQPSSPAYAAFSLQTPAPFRPLSNRSPERLTFSPASSDQTSGTASSSSKLVPPHPIVGQLHQSTRSSIRRDKITARHVRRRMKRATSLPLADEITLARFQQNLHHRRNSSSLSNPSTHSTYSAPSCIISNNVGMKQDSVGGRECHAGPQQECRIAERTDNNSTILGDNGKGTNDGSTIYTQQKIVSEVATALPDRELAMQRNSLKPQPCQPPALLTASQLAAMHQSNMPKPARAAPALPGYNRASLVEHPPRIQTYAQAQRRLPQAGQIPELVTASEPTSLGASEAARVNIAPTQTFVPSVQNQVKPPPTASVPAYTPPIAKDTLRELDLQEILQCRQLRHDVVFDANLMFRPNFDGDRGDRKREAADRYWTAITRELESGCRCTAYSFAPSATARMMGKPSVPLPCICTDASMPHRRRSIYERLPSRIAPLIQELRDILLALLPSPATEKDTSSRKLTKSSSQPGCATAQMIIDTLDPALMTQEVAHGVLDASSLATFFGQVIKTHCAPMRDETVETMVQTIKKGGETNNMRTVSNGLRMCFEILELMKLDIANHQLRMLRPYLLETAAEFEYKSFLHLRDKKAQPADEAAMALDSQVEGPPLSKTRAWLAAVRERETAGMEADPSRIVDGILQLLFQPSEESKDAVSGRSPSQTRQTTSLERVRKPKSQALPQLGEIPETLQLDVYRLQMFHGDIVDLCIVHLLLLLYRQLCMANKIVPTSEDVDGIRRQIWVIMSEVNTAAISSTSLAGRQSAAGLPQSIKKLESEGWRKGMKDVLLQIARFSSRTPAQGSGSEVLPDTATLEVLDGWMDSNLRAGSRLFQLVQTRLRKALYGLITHELRSQSKLPGERVCHMPPKEYSSESGSDRNNIIIKQNGLSDLSNEICLLGSRISKVAGFNARVFKDLYASML